MAANRPRSGRQWVILAVAGVVLFVVGLLVGGVAGGDGGGGTAEGTASSEPSASSTPSADATSAAPAPVTAADVAAACVRAGQGAQEALDAIDEAGDAVADLDAERLDTLIDGLRPLRLALPGDIADCRAAVSGTTGASTTPSATASTTASG